MRAFIYEAKDFCPYINLAAEEMLLKLVEKEKLPCLYLWQNDNTVVVGKHQNVYTECNLEFCKHNNIHIVRRLSGGGAVYHDKGNLNFSIILPISMKDISKSMQVIVDALKSIGICACMDGRNDICVDGGKISGNAFYAGEYVSLHHGTILIKADKEHMEKALLVSGDKLSKHGVASVRSRVTDVTSCVENADIFSIKNSIKTAFVSAYDIEELIAPDIEGQELKGLISKYESDEWNYNRLSEYTDSVTGQFEWGSVEVESVYDGDKLKNVSLYSDSIEVEFLDYLCDYLNSPKENDYEMTQIQKKIFDDIMSLL